MDLTMEHLRAWLERYFGAWVSNDPAAVAALFTPDALYWTDPFKAPRSGVREIVDAWVSGPQEEVEYAFEPLAVAGDRGMAHWRVTSRRPGTNLRDQLDGVLLLSFAGDGRCTEHREWFSHRQLPETP